VSRLQEHSTLKEWRHYEQQVCEEFREMHPGGVIEHNRFEVGKYSGVRRQLDVWVTLPDVGGFGAFDCKRYRKPIDVQHVDRMIGYLEDIGASWGGLVTTNAFSAAARARAAQPAIELHVIKFRSVHQLVREFAPSLDFSDPRNSQYVSLLF
jgi:hypothetical protein